MADRPSFFSALLALLGRVRRSLAAFKASNQKDHDAIRHKCCNSLDDD
jgi:hypothetical protein